MVPRSGRLPISEPDLWRHQWRYQHQYQFCAPTICGKEKAAHLIWESKSSSMASRWKLSTSAWVKKTAEVKTTVRKNPPDITCALAILLALAIQIKKLCLHLLTKFNKRLWWPAIKRVSYKTASQLLILVDTHTHTHRCQFGRRSFRKIWLVSSSQDLWVLKS